MLLQGYSKKVSWSECRAHLGTLQCFAVLDQDVSDALPYFNALIDGEQYTTQPPSVLFRTEDRVIVVYGREIAISKVEDEGDAELMLEWLKERINEAWMRKSEISPRYGGHPKPSVVEILKIMGNLDCRSCGQPSCVAFAAGLAQGDEDLLDCLSLSDDKRRELQAYLSRFQPEREELEAEATV